MLRRCSFNIRNVCTTSGSCSFRCLRPLTLTALRESIQLYSSQTFRRTASHRTPNPSGSTPSLTPDLHTVSDEPLLGEGKQATEDFAAGIETSMAINVDLARDFYGPWLVMADELDALKGGGELFVERDGFVFYRPREGLGYGIGRLELISAEGALGTAFLMDLELYTYSPNATKLPTISTKIKLSGIVNKVLSKSTHYTTFSLFGAWERPNGQNEGNTDPTFAVEEHSPTDAQHVLPKDESNFAGAFHAAKVMPWDPSTSTENATWAPKPELQVAFQQVFPQPIQLSSHLQRAAAAKQKQRERQTTTGVKGPFHLDLAPYRVSPLSELYYIPDYISKEEEVQMVERIQATPEEFKSKLKKRTCQEWGCTMCDVCNQSFVSDANMPQWVQQITDMLVYDGLFTPATFPNSVRIHEYQANEGIGPHADGPIYVPMVTVLSGASTSVMHFYPRTPLYDDPMQHYKDTFQFKDGPIGSQKPLLSVVMEPRSLLVFLGDVYYSYPHGVSDEPVIDLSPECSGEVVNRHLLKDPSVQQIKRSYRVSLTTRNLLPRCRDQPRRMEYGMKRAWYLYHQQPVPETLFPPLNSEAMPSSSGSTSTTSPAGPLSPSELCRWEQKLDRVLQEQEALSRQVKELKDILTVTLQSAAHFQTETSGVLNHLTSTMLDVQSRTEETLELLEESAKEMPKK